MLTTTVADGVVRVVVDGDVEGAATADPRERVVSESDRSGPVRLDARPGPVGAPWLG